MATRAMKFLLGLYPGSWRRRYGPEMSDLLEQLPSGPGVAMDLLIGAAAAYATAIRDNRVLSSAASYVHGVCVAVLVQAIAFVTLILFSQQSRGLLTVSLGPFQFVSVRPGQSWGIRTQLGALISNSPDLGALPLLAVVVPLLVALVLVVTGPRWVRKRLV